jgi:UDP-N-acetylglucosamine 4-epimerase
LNGLFDLQKKDLIDKGVPCGNVDVKYASGRAGDIPHSFADISRAEEELGYRVLFSIEEGIREMTGYYMENFS